MSALRPEHLLTQARQLVSEGGVKPRQASLRRGVSTAYYALFHLLVGDASRSLARGLDPRVAGVIARAFAHEEMKAACRSFAGGTVPSIVGTAFSATAPLAVPLDLREVADAFVNLQQARHEADYGTARAWTRSEAIAEVVRAEQAFLRWQALKASKNAPDSNARSAFLLWLALGKRLQGR